MGMASKDPTQARNFYHKCLANLRKAYKGTGMEIGSDQGHQTALLLKYCPGPPGGGPAPLAFPSVFL